ncbi:DinB family protein [Kribbella sp. NPDC051770]|uniref:DinB family protein n=1 Tax=Kribbella sp. NPDC051770 TaxID=3155413 RepID=UPI00341845DA
MELHGRVDPPYIAGELETLLGFLDFQRGTFRWKIEGLTPEQLGTAVLAPSALTLHGLVRHLTEDELGWFVGPFSEGATSYPYSSDAAPDAAWSELDPAAYAADLQRYHDSVEQARAAIAGLPGDHVVDDEGTSYSLRWIVTHMIEEYARHNGHADLLREHLDGSTGE